MPVVGEVFAFEALAADLFGVEAVDDGVVDVFEELAVDAFVDGAFDAVGIDEEDGYAGISGHGGLGGEGKDEGWN